MIVYLFYFVKRRFLHKLGTMTTLIIKETGKRSDENSLKGGKRWEVAAATQYSFPTKPKQINSYLFYGSERDLIYASPTPHLFKPYPQLNHFPYPI